MIKNLKKQNKTKSVVGWAVVLNRAITSVYMPSEWFGCYTIFNKKEDAKYWLENKARNDGKIIEVLITPIK